MYTDFAKVYDLFMEDIPYDEWSEYILELLSENGITEGSIVELGCGTGEITTRLAKSGYSVIGIDISEEMLFEAGSKLSEEDILYVNMDMTELSLPYQVDAMVSVCDSMNYLVEDGDFELTVKAVYEYLKEDGVFIFDLKTKYFYENILGTTTIAETREDASFIWENTYYEDECINEYELTLFIKEEEGDKYERYDEVHLQRAFEFEEIVNILKKVDFSEILVYNAFTKNEPTDDTERYYFVCRKGKR